MPANGGNTVPRITKAEHIGPQDTGDNIEAKRVAVYYWNGTDWQRATQGSSSLVTAQFDYIERTLTNSTTETYTYKTGGQSGTTVATVVVVYTDSTLNTVSTVTRT